MNRRVDRPRMTLALLAGLLSMVGCADDKTTRTQNTPPESAAGPDQYGSTEHSFTLSGSGSRDAEGDSLTFAWLEDNANPALGLLSDAATESTVFSPAAAGTYVFVLTVSDGSDESRPDSMTVSVQAPPRPVATPAGTVHEMVHVPAGSFEMGSVEGQIRERPVRRVTVDGYYIDTYEVTAARYVAYLNANGSNQFGGRHLLELDHTEVQVRQSDGGSFELKSAGIGDHPVVLVTWYGARAYCDWAALHIPTEAQWAKAARGTDGRTYPWGEGIDPSSTNYYYSEDRGRSVGSFPTDESPYGARDMAGNVEEWVADWMGPYDPEDLNNPTGPNSSTGLKVTRGGDWGDPVSRVRPSTRRQIGPTSARGNIGFRCAQEE